MTTSCDNQVSSRSSSLPKVQSPNYSPMDSKGIRECICTTLIRLRFEVWGLKQNKKRNGERFWRVRNNILSMESMSHPYWFFKKNGQTLTSRIQTNKSIVHSVMQKLPLLHGSKNYFIYFIKSLLKMSLYYVLGKCHKSLLKFELIPIKSITFKKWSS